MITDEEKRQLSRLVKNLAAEGHLNRRGAEKLLECIESCNPPEPKSKRGKKKH